MPPSKKQKTAEVYNASDGPQEDNIRFANTLTGEFIGLAAGFFSMGTASDSQIISTSRYPLRRMLLRYWRWGGGMCGGWA